MHRLLRICSDINVNSPSSMALNQIEGSDKSSKAPRRLQMGCADFKGAAPTSKVPSRLQRRRAHFKGAEPTSKAPRPLQRCRAHFKDAALTSKAPRPLQRRRDDFKDAATTSKAPRRLKSIPERWPFLLLYPNYPCSGHLSSAAAVHLVQREPAPCTGGRSRAAAARPVQRRCFCAASTRSVFLRTVQFCDDLNYKVTVSVK